MGDMGVEKEEMKRKNGEKEPMDMDRRIIGIRAKVSYLLVETLE